MDNYDYDMYVDCETLDDKIFKLRNIIKSLEENIVLMKKALEVSDGYLEGEQFEKAKMVTMSCLAYSDRASKNIGFTIMYLQELKSITEEYLNLKYE